MTNEAGASAPGDPQYSAPPIPPTAPPVAPPPVTPPTVSPDQQYAGAPVSASQPGQGRAAGKFDSAALQNFDPKTVDPKDWGIIAAGVLTFIFSLFSYYKYSVKVAGFGGNSATVSAWHGFFGWFAALVALASALVLAAHLIAEITLPFPVRLAVLGGFALALLCTLLALFIVPGDTGGAGALGVSIDKGHGFSYWLSWILLLAGGALSYLRFTETGGKLPSRP